MPTDKKKATPRKKKTVTKQKKYTLYYATNRNHKGREQWRPSGYGPDFSKDGAENLRFGKVSVQADPNAVVKQLAKAVGFGIGDGNGLAKYFSGAARKMQIEAFEENIDQNLPEGMQQPKLGSARSFSELQQAMRKSADLLVFVHGFNVSWRDAVASALALQETVNRDSNYGNARPVMVFLLSWPSDGLALPYASYKSDRTDAESTGYAFGRGLLKLRDFFRELRTRDDSAQLMCKQELHLLCHSMGNYVLQNTLARLIDYNPGSALPRLFDHLFMCAPDVDDNIFDPYQALSRLPEIARSVSIYHNRGDIAMSVSDYTKGNPERLGMAGAAKPAMLHNKIHQVDCSPIVEGLVEHSYFLSGRVNEDIRMSIAGVRQDDASRHRELKGKSWPNIWQMK